jgi:hypothetical protein
MNMEMYWSQPKVFLMGTLALFPEKLEGKVVTLAFDQYYFDARNDEQFLAELYKYEKDGYFQFHEIPLLTAGLNENDIPPRGFMIDRINTNKATDDLMEYLERWNSDILKSAKATKPADSTHQKTKLYDAIAVIFALQKHPRIKWTDLYDRKDYTAPFWETLLYDPIVTGNMSVIDMGHGDAIEPESSVMYEFPYVELKITDPLLRRELELKSKSSQPINEEDLIELHYKGLTANRDGTISYNGNRIPFTPQEVDAMRVLMERPEELRYYDSFTDPLANIFDGRSYDNVQVTLSKLFYSLRKKLNEATDQQAITNSSKRGYTLKLQ